MQRSPEIIRLTVPQPGVSGKQAADNEGYDDERYRKRSRVFFGEFFHGGRADLQNDKSLKKIRNNKAI